MLFEMTTHVTKPQPPPNRMFRIRLIARAAVFTAICLLAVGCDDEPSEPSYVARVGDRYLLEADVQQALESLPAPQDSTEARRQIVEQWVTAEVLYQEAVRRGLAQDPEVRRRLRDSERSVLVNSLMSRLYEEYDVSPSPSEMESYFERHKEQLRLRENFVRVRYVPTRTRQEAEEARRTLQEAAPADRDSVWSETVDRVGAAAAVAREITSNYYPESRLFADRPALQQVVVGLGEGQTAPVVETDSIFHVLQLAERVPPGTIPEPEWIEDELARRLMIQGRKQLYARQVQRFRNEALAREDLDLK